MFLDILDDIFLLHFALETAERAFDRLAVLHFHFSQAAAPPITAERGKSKIPATSREIPIFTGSKRALYAGELICVNGQHAAEPADPDLQPTCAGCAPCPYNGPS
jgi:hypothetical protein